MNSTYSFKTLDEQAVSEFIDLLANRSEDKFSGQTVVDLFHRDGKLHGMNIAHRKTVIRDGKVAR